MECHNCELKQRQFYCENCLRGHLREFRLQIQHYASDRDVQVSKAAKLLDAVATPARVARADVARWEERVKEVMSGLEILKKENDAKRDRLRILREQLASRRQSLSIAQRTTPKTLNNTNPFSYQDLHSPTQLPPQVMSLSTTLARARSGLVQELVEVFNVVEVGGRPPVSGRAGTKGEWTIADLILPVPGDIRRYPPDHINAVMTHTIHFLSLLTFYLGVKLPFEILWSGGKLGVGQPWIGAGAGGEGGGWVRYSQKHSLHLSSATNSPMPPPSEAQAQVQAAFTARTLSSESYSEHAKPTSPQSNGGGSSFSTAFAMLLYNVCYLAWTQGVDIPLAQAGDVLNNLWGVCCSPELGKKSHQTTNQLVLLLPPTPPGFTLDFAQLLQVTTRPGKPGRVVHATKPKTRKVHEEKIVEEDDGWDMVDDVGDGGFT